MVNGVLCCAIISAASRPMITLAVIALVASFNESVFRLNPKEQQLRWEGVMKIAVMMRVTDQILVWAFSQTLWCEPRCRWIE